MGVWVWIIYWEIVVVFVVARVLKWMVCLPIMLSAPHCGNHVGTSSATGSEHQYQDVEFDLAKAITRGKRNSDTI